MKRVFSNSGEVAHIWAQQTQSEGRSSNCYFEGATIYSYGRHYPLGVILKNKKGEKCAVINAAGYSVTTTKHIRQARCAVNHYTRFDVHQTKLMCRIVDAQRRAALDVKALAACVSQYVIERAAGFASVLSSEDAKRRKAATIEKWRGEAISDVQSALDVLAWAGGKLDAKARKTVEGLAGNLVLLREKAEKLRESEKRKQAKAAKERAKEQAALVALAIPAWLAGERTVQLGGENRDTYSAMQYAPQVYLRINGEAIETSRGARFPLAHGLRALPLIRAIVASGGGWHRNGQTIQLGHYQIDSVESGIIMAGCHKLLVSEVERLAASLGV
jgi:hypothetical protein